MNRYGKRCVLYPRVSTEMQVDGYSLEGQKNMLTRFADREEMIVVDTYEDAGKSGKSIEGRPAFQKMLRDIEDGLDIDYILVYKLSRFGRNAADILNSLELVQSYGVNLICIEEGIDSSQTSGKLLISVLSAVAEIERENIIEQTMNGRREKARQGGWNGGFAPYGYTLEDNKLMIEETEAVAIRKIFELYTSSEIGLGGIANQLNLQGIRKIPRQNGTLEDWTGHFIKLILDNPVYCGKIAYGRRTKEKVKGTKNDYQMKRNDDYILTEGQHKGIVSEEVWEKAHAKRLRTGVKQPSKIGRDRVHLLSGLLKCPVCGSPMYTNKHAWTNKDGTYKEIYYYVCSRNRMVRGKHCEYKAMLKKTDIEPMVIEAIREIVRNEEYAQAIKKRIGVQIDTKAVDKELEGYQAKLKEVDLNKTRLEREIDSLPADAKYRERKLHDMTLRLDSLYDVIVELEEKIEDARLRRDAIKQQAITLENIYKIMVNFDCVYNIINDEEKRNVVTALIKEIEIYRNDESEYPLKRIGLNFPVFKDGGEVTELLWDKGNTVEINEDVTLTEDLTIPKGKTLGIDGYGTLTIAPGATLALEGTVEADWEQNISGGLLECGALMVLQGTFSAGTGAHANLYGTITVENGGSLIVNGGAFFGGDSFTVKAGGHVTNNGWISFGEDSVITVEDGWAAAWTQGEGAEANKNVAVRLEQGDNADQKIQKALADINASTLPGFFSYTVPVYREDSGERIELTQDLTIPAGVELGFYNEGATTYIAEGAALTVQGGLYSDAPITVDGKLTVSANGYANVQKNLLVGGTLTIDEDGWMYCWYLTDENEQGKAGTIVNNGSLAAEQFDLKHNEVDIGGGDDGSKVVRSLEALKSALAEGGQINYRGTELTISEDLTIPENVNLTINVTTFTVNEGVTLTNKGNVWLHGDAYLYGKLDVSNESGYIRGYGFVKAGGEDNLVGDEYGNRWFNWTSRISKEGASETLTQEELTAAGASTLANRIEIDLGSQTTLTLADGLEIRDKNVSIWGTNAAKVVVNGTLSVWRHLSLDAPMTVNGTVDVYGGAYASRDITVNTGGKLHVRNYYDESEHRQWTGSVEFGDAAWIALPEGAAMGDYVIVDEGCTLVVQKYIAASELEETLRNCADGRRYIIQVDNDQSQSEKRPLYIAAGTTVTIPENVTVLIPDYNIGGFSEFAIGAADENGTKGELVVNGRLEVDVPARVEGTLTVNGSARFGNGYEVRANGAMLVNAGGEMVITGKLTGTGTITNNGTLTANEKAMGTVIGGSGKTTIGNTRLEASNMAELKTALSGLSGSTERLIIYLCRSAMDAADPYFVIDGDITVPSNVQLRMDEMRFSSFRGLTVAENVKLTIAGDVYSWAEDGVTVNGTLETLYGGQDESGNWIPNGRIVAYSVTVASTGHLVNGGNTDVNARDEQTGGTLVVEGVLENSDTVNCRDLQYSGTALTNKGDIRVRQQLKIAEGSVIENTGWITYGDCDALDKINNSGKATIHWEKTVNTVEELRALLTRTDEGTIILRPQGEETLTEDLAIPENIELVFAADHGQAPTLTVSEGVTLSANGQLNIQKSATLAVNGTLATCNNVQVNGALLISESGVWKQKNSASVNNDSASITINGTLEQSESWVELTDWDGMLVFGANARWNEVGTVRCYGDDATITGFDPGRYELRSDGDYYYLKRISSGGGSGGGETSVTGDVNGDGVVDQADLVALARFMAGIDDLEDTTRADINGDGIYSAADLTALARMLEAQQDTQTADADGNGAPVDTGAELNADAQDTVQTEDGGAPAEPAPVVDDVPETVEESVTGEVPQTEAGEQAA